MQIVYNFIYVALGGAIGSMLRYALIVLSTVFSFSTTISTICANLCGSFLIGLVISLSTNSTFTLFASVGLCGGFTTFSTFSAQTLQMLQSGQYWAALAYALISLVSCVVFVGLGLFVGNCFK